MNERDLIITITGEIARGTSRPTRVIWRVKAGAEEPVEATQQAVTEACRALNSALKEAVK